MAFDHSVDVLVVGSGGGALTAALTAQARGADVLVVEKADVYGGTSAMSGGSIWIPNSPYVKAAGGEDSREDAMTYLDTCIDKDINRARIEAYVDNGPRMLKFLEENSHVTFMCQAYSDYYPEITGGKRGYRTHEPNPMDAKVLGRDFKTMRGPHHALIVLGRYSMNNTEGYYLLTQAPGWKKVMFKIMARYWTNLRARLMGRRDARLTMGNALVGRLRWSLNDRKVPVWLNSPLKELIVEGNKVRGAVVERDGKTMRIEARKGVVMGAGGFEHDQKMRDMFLPKPTSAAWSASNNQNTGDAIKAGMSAGGVTSLMQHAWWIPVIPVPGYERPWAIFAERSLPRNVLVNAQGKRFTNEAAPYLEAGEALYTGNRKDAPSIPAYLVFDTGFRRKYPFGPLKPSTYFPDSTLPEAVRNGLLHKADTVAELARKIGVDAGNLEDTIRKNNAYAKLGHDPDFKRGDSFYDKYYGDATHRPSPCIGPIDTPPYYAIALYPGDIGTKGGLLTDEYARVMKSDGIPFEGLYAIGNTAASVMGTKYPGAGSTIGPSMVFGYIAANHMTGANA